MLWPNFKNENLSVELPIFIIHGNHDDPSGIENISSKDIFANKELNYFGKINDYENFDLFPILFQKGKIKRVLIWNRIHKRWKIISCITE